MSKLDIGVGDEFPLDERPAPRGRRLHRHAHHHHDGHRHHHHGHSVGIGRFALLLVIAGLVALIVHHQMTAAMALGLIATGGALLVLTFALRAFRHWCHYRKFAPQAAS